eukprot:scaffold141802_cov33-Tisochrysis_lutea.AAC.5
MFIDGRWNIQQLNFELGTCVGHIADLQECPKPHSTKETLPALFGIECASTENTYGSDGGVMSPQHATLGREDKVAWSTSDALRCKASNSSCGMIGRGTGDIA